MKSGCFWINCSYDNNNDTKNNKTLVDHADHPDTECWIYFIELLRVLWVKQEKLWAML